jgi:hypothetical protein
LLNGTDEWHERQQELSKSIAATALEQPQHSVLTPPAATDSRPKAFVVHSRFRPWTFKNKFKK